MSGQAQMGKTDQQALRKDRDGIVAVEFALMIPVLLFLVVGLVDYGAVVNRKMELVHAIQAGLQYALGAPPVDGDMTAVIAATAFAAPADNADRRRIEARMFCECPGQGEISCTAGCVDGSARSVHMSIGIDEDIRFLFGYPVLGEAITVSNDGSIRLY